MHKHVWLAIQAWSSVTQYDEFHCSDLKIACIFIQALEKRTKESKQEMDILEKLEELRDLNTRLANGINIALLCTNVYNIFL